MSTSNEDLAVTTLTHEHAHNLSHPQVAEIQHIHNPQWDITGLSPLQLPTNVPHSHSYILTMHSQCQIAEPFKRTTMKSKETEAFKHLV